MTSGPTIPRQTLALLIPAYNAAAWLPRLLASAAAQTEPFDEIWVYDDASSDDTAVVAERLGAGVIRGTVNRGCSAGKNALARHVAADWLHFHDADDELLPHFVVRARRWIDEGSRDVVLFAYEERDNHTGQHMAISNFDAAELERDARGYAVRRQINPFCGLYRREAYLAAGGYDEDPLVLFNEDVAMHIQLAFAGLSFSADPEVSLINHRRSDSMSGANQVKCARAQYHVMRKTAERPAAEPYSRDLARRLWEIAGVLAAQLDWNTADAAAALAARLSPGEIQGSAMFRALAAASPPLALRFREGLIRGLKPGLRRDYPRAGALPAGGAQ